ncbi:STAS domain-containing protein [Chitinivibrio alkaliphilus]|uniref:Anti-sigma-factor antagonist n=1 Tax=Chitinivibrio alkaliphilus ACht1 TaxID=1313304 RepID=U7D8A0_9BACT|nr:STAS domain-containing protein [Chitinivibrio alkaliphilus]ERP31796.1 anti-sigma-factor antagonist [Chitinivibrio alkaliphilus ACht1]
MEAESIYITEDIVSSTVGNLHDEISDIIADGVEKIVLNMEAVDIIDSTGIGFIIKIQNSLKKNGGSLTLENVNSDIVRMFKVMRLDKHIRIV